MNKDFQKLLLGTNACPKATSCLLVVVASRTLSSQLADDKRFLTVRRLPQIASSEPSGSLKQPEPLPEVHGRNIAICFQINRTFGLFAAAANETENAKWNAYTCGISGDHQHCPKDIMGDLLFFSHRTTVTLPGFVRCRDGVGSIRITGPRSNSHHV